MVNGILQPWPSIKDNEIDVDICVLVTAADCPTTASGCRTDYSINRAVVLWRSHLPVETLSELDHGLAI